MNLERLWGYTLTSVVVRTDLQPSEGRVVLNSEGGSVTLRFARIWHARVDVGIVEGDFVGEVVVRELPQYGPWPTEAHHLLHHHDNRAVLYWLTINGTGSVEVLAEAIDIDWPSALSNTALGQQFASDSSVGEIADRGQDLGVANWADDHGRAGIHDIAPGFQR